jgi:hypothetical protein
MKILMWSSRVPVAVVVLGAVAAAALGQAKVPQNTTDAGTTKRSGTLNDVEQELLKGLPGGRDARPRDADTKQGARGDASGMRGLESTQTRDAAGEPSRIAELARRMRSVEKNLTDGTTGSATQSEQAEIARLLSALLDAANQGGQKSSKSNDAGKTASGSAAGKAAAAGAPRESSQRVEHGDLERSQAGDVQSAMRRVWGHLPDKVREEMQASLGEQFLPKYERVIEEYYRRLAEETMGKGVGNRE